MNLQQMRYIRETIRHDFNLTTAATSLFTSQPGLSKAIREFEQELGTVVFIRQAKRLTGLTDEGKQLAIIIERLLVEAENLKRVASELRDGDQGELRIAATHTQARYTLPSAMVSLRKAFPKVAVSIKQGTPTQIVQMLSASEVDLGIATEALSNNNLLDCKKLFSWRHMAIVPINHLLASESSVSLTQLARYDIVTYVHEFAGRSRIDAAFEAIGIKPRIVIEATDSDVIKTYVGLGLGVGIVSELALKANTKTQKSDGFAVLAIRPTIGSNNTYIAHRAGRLLKRYEEHLIGQLLR